MARNPPNRSSVFPKTHPRLTRVEEAAQRLARRQDGFTRKELQEALVDGFERGDITDTIKRGITAGWFKKEELKRQGSEVFKAP
jgi:hypothetical protein